MTFTEIVADVARDLNLRGDETLTRIGASVNHRHRRILRALGMNVYSRIEVDVDLAAGTQDQIYDLDDPVLCRLVALYYKPAATATNPNPKSTMLDELTFEEMKEVVPTEDDVPQSWCKVRVGANWTQFKIDSTIPNGATVTVEGEEVPSQLEGDMPPYFDENFHEMLVVGAKADECARMKTPEGRALAKDFNADFDNSLGELRLKQTLMAGGLIRQGKHGKYTNPLVRSGPSING